MFHGKINGIHDNADPAVRFLLDLLDGSMSRTIRAEHDAGLGTDTIRGWRYQRHAVSRGPHIDCLRRALNALGYDLAVIDRTTGKVVP